MIDLYLHAPTLAALLVDLAILGLVVDGELAPGSVRHGLVLAVDGEADGNGVVAALRCLDEALLGEVMAAALASARIVPRPEGWRWAGD